MMMQKLAAELFGTFFLVFAGTGAIVINDVRNGTVTHVGIALTFGLVVLALIYALGDVSGAHFNPAVTIGFWAAGRFPAKSVPAYVASQSAGALCASLLLRCLFPTHAVDLSGRAPPRRVFRRPLLPLREGGRLLSGLKSAVAQRQRRK